MLARASAFAAAATAGGAAPRRQHQRRGVQPCSALLQQRPPAGEGEQQHEHARPAISLLQRAAGAGAALAATALLLAPGGAALASDSAKVGTCLLQNCQSALTNCLADGPCVQNLVCLQLCNNSPDETACQIKCGDRYTSGAIEAFNTCVVSEKKCVPQRVDKGVFPVPPDCALDAAFDLNGFQGRWYISAGLNPLFDTFDCQAHYFTSPEPGKVYAKINWRIPMMDPISEEPDFAERSTMQRFVQIDPERPGVLFNGNNDFLHYEDTWYVLASKPNEYVFIYYLGNNDAWRGYGGATVYTREASLPEEYIPELKAAAEAAGLDWSAFALTDNSCPPHPPERSLPQRLEVGAERRLQEVEYELENDLRSFGRGFTVLEKDLSATLRAEEARVASGLQALEAEALRDAMALREEAARAGKAIRRMEMEASMGPWVNWIPKSWRPVIMPLPEDRPTFMT